MRTLKACTFVIIALVASIGLFGKATAGGVPEVAGLCGEGFNPILLCGLQEALCVPADCTDFGAVSCCPPMECPPDDDECVEPDQGSPECQGSRASCGSSCECFVVSVNGTMAPMLGRAPLAILLVSLFAGGLWLAGSRTGSRL